MVSRRDRYWEAAAIAAILLAAAALRLIQLGSLPPGLFQDEAVNGINAQTILAGAPRIYYGEREPLYMYLAALVTLALGPTPLALRVAAAASGLVGVAAGGAFARQLFGRTVGLLTAAGLAASLWLTTISRIGFRAITFPAIECLGLALLWRATRTGRRHDFALSGVFLGFSLYTYLASRFLPFALVLFVIAAFVVDRQWIRKQLPGFIIAGAVAFVVCLPLGYYALHHPDMLMGRPGQVALPTGQGYLAALIANVGRTLGMLFFHGDENWRQNFSGAPVFDPLNSVVFLVGLLVAVRWFRRTVLLVLILFLVMLVPSMLSIDSPHYLRTSGAAIAIYTLWALGLAWLGQRVARFARKPDPHPNPLPEGEGTGTSTRSTSVSPSPAPLERGRGGEAAAALVIAVVLVVAFARTGWTYFVDYARNPAVPDAFNANLAAAGRFLATSPIWKNDRANVYLTDRYLLNRASVAFFVYPQLPLSLRPIWLDERTIGSFFSQDDAVPLPVAPSVYIVDGTGQTTLDSLGPAVQRTEQLRDGTWTAGRVIWAAPVPATWFGKPVAATFGDWLELERVNVRPTTVGLRWKVLAIPKYQPSVYVHVQDGQGHTLATADQVVGFPVKDWRVGQEFVTWHPIHLPPGTPPGTYLVTTGVYRKETSAREPATLAGKAVGDVSVGQLDLTSPVAGTVVADLSLNRPVAPGLTIVGYDLGATEVEAGTKVSLTLVWKATGDQRGDAEAAVSARSASGAVLGTWQGPVGGPTYPTSHWPAGQEIRELIDVPIAATANGPLTLSVVVNAASKESFAPISLTGITAKASVHQFTAPSPKHALNAAFAGVGTLIGNDLPDRVYQPGQTVPITLYWKSQGAAPASYTVFVHILDAQNHVVGQRDELPAHGARPTTGWVDGEYVVDQHDVTVDTNVAPGTYQIEIGLYDPRNGQRVATGTTDNRVVIGSVRIGAASDAAPR